MDDPATDSSDVLQRTEQAQAQSKALREQVARTAEAVAETEQEVARVHRKLADQGGPLAAEAREQVDRAEEFAAKERAEYAHLDEDQLLSGVQSAAAEAKKGLQEGGEDCAQ